MNRLHLPQPIVHDLEPRADPASGIAKIAFLKETVAGLEAKVRELKQKPIELAIRNYGTASDFTGTKQIPIR